MVATSHLLMLLAAAASSIASARPSPPAAPCTPEQEAAYAPYRVLSRRCDIQSVFKVCDDDCLSLYERQSAHAPDCGLDGSEKSQARLAELMLESCTSTRPMTSNKYMPKETPGLPNCTRAESLAYGRDVNDPEGDFRKCTKNLESVYAKPFCTEKCLSVIQTAIVAAPPCLTDGNYTEGEKLKRYLVTCLNASGIDVQTNKVLQTVPGETTSPSSITTPDDRSAVKTVAPSTSPSATTKAPATSSSAMMPISVAVGVAALCSVASAVMF